MLKPDPIHTKSSNFVDPDSPEGGPELNDSPRVSRTDLAIDPLDSERMAQKIFWSSEQEDLGGAFRNYRTVALTATVVALSILLGWMVGRAGWNMAVHRAESQTPEMPAAVLAANTSVRRDPLPISAGAEQLTDLATASSSTTPALSPLKPAPKSDPTSRAGAVQPDGALVMYERGRLVFRAAPIKAPSSVDHIAAVQTEVNSEGNSPAAPEQNLRQAANDYLITRVVPTYPEEAKEQRVQGSVVLHALVGIDGSVRELKVISGDPRLVQAAADAVRQWRFQPNRFKGEISEFETRITVNFSLP